MLQLPYLGRKMTRFDQSHDDTVDDPGDELWAEVPLHDGGEQQLVAADGAPVSAHSARQHRVAVVEVGEDLHQHLARQRPPAQLSHPPWVIHYTILQDCSSMVMPLFWFWLPVNDTTILTIEDETSRRGWGD